MGNRYSPQQLERFARNHISYEINQLLAMARAKPAASAWTNNATLESLLIHARLLDEFLTLKPDDKYPDVRAAHYLDDYTTSCLDTSTRREIGRRVAHLSGQRTVGYDWNTMAITNRVIEGMRRFQRALTQSRHPERASWFVIPSDNAPVVIASTTTTTSSSFTIRSL